MPSTTFYNLPAEKRERLLSAARAEFARAPYEEASVNRMIRAAGIPRGSFYMYFTDKEELFRFLMETYSGMLSDWMGAQLAQNGGDLFAAFLALFDFIQANRESVPFQELAAILHRNRQMQPGLLLEGLRPGAVLERLRPQVDLSCSGARRPSPPPAVSHSKGKKRRNHYGSNPSQAGGIRVGSVGAGEEDSPVPGTQEEAQVGQAADRHPGDRGPAGLPALPVHGRRAAGPQLRLSALHRRDAGHDGLGLRHRHHRAHQRLPGDQPGRGRPSTRGMCSSASTPAAWRTTSSSSSSTSSPLSWPWTICWRPRVTTRKTGMSPPRTAASSPSCMWIRGTP